MSRLTINESADGYTDKIILSPGDFTTAAGNTTTQVDIPVKKGDVIYGAALNITEAGALQISDGNITVISASALDVSTSGKLTLQLAIRRLNG